MYSEQIYEMKKIKQLKTEDGSDIGRLPIVDTLFNSE